MTMTNADLKKLRTKSKEYAFRAARGKSTDEAIRELMKQGMDPKQAEGKVMSMAQTLMEEQTNHFMELGRRYSGKV